ncbi:MAG: DUF6134 family protein [Ekhidna sp.]|uniref:DUF6134 family protein n=1 Tax=Ekhidna sp. TaxID=2608089 RepID=UPI0032EE579B
MRRYLTILSLFFVCHVAFGQVLHYEVVKGSKKLGDMKVKRMLSENQVKYEITSEVTFRILFSFTVDYESNSEYKYGQLIKEYTHNKLNGSTQKESTVWFDGKQYTLDINGVKSHPHEKRIEYSVAAIYFEEPTDSQQVYSPQFGQFLKFTKVGEHEYEMESPDGINLYTYTNGICSEVKVSRDFAKFYFQMTPESLLAVKEKKIIGGSITVD